jgi:predicted membrane protein
MDMRKGFALLLIGFGALTLLSNFYAFRVEDIWQYLWPAALILIGLSSLIKNRQLQIFSLILLVIGGLFFLRALRILDISNQQIWSYIWPSVLILLGLNVLFTRESRRIHVQVSDNSDDTTKKVNDKHRSSSNQGTYNVIMGGISERVDSQEFKQCTVNSVMGAADIDFSNIYWETGSAYLELNALMGAIECIVPTGVKLEINGTPIAAGFENNAISQDDSERTLKISYTAILGGIELKQKQG